MKIEDFNMIWKEFKEKFNWKFLEEQREVLANMRDEMYNNSVYISEDYYFQRICIKHK
jgi:hypothetical protein